MASRNKVTAQQAARLLGWNEQALRNHAAAGRISWAVGVPPHDGKKGQCNINAFALAKACGLTMEQLRKEIEEA